MRYPRTRAMSDVVEEQLESVQDPAAAADPTRHLDAVAEGIRIIEAAAAAAAAGSSTASVATSASDFVLVRMGGRDSAEPDKVTVERVSAAAAAAAVASKHHHQHQQQQQPGGCAGRGLCPGVFFVVVVVLLGVVPLSLAFSTSAPFAPLLSHVEEINPTRVSFNIIGMVHGSPCPWQDSINTRNISTV